MTSTSDGSPLMSPFKTNGVFNDDTRGANDQISNRFFFYDQSEAKIKSQHVIDGDIRMDGGWTRSVSVPDPQGPEPPLAPVCMPDLNAASTATRLSSSGLGRSACQETVTQTRSWFPSALHHRAHQETAVPEVRNQRRAGGGAT